ncbi:cytosine permease [Salipaludibacillus keqinensis]|uniref:Cytosine permease n=1 Tax=Salipaludibacillus keqinensis TaxID=2045207 RepID=A0A323TKS2_9BACI|nr:cytosine permease [Salipaludibacillus keqinensis]PYZ94574.1 cytosine permease [Salipaludibacillus keqinensis]
MEESLQKKRSTTKLETLGLEPVPSALKTTTAWDYIRIQVAISINAGNMLVPALAVIEGGLSFFQAVLSTVVGAWIAFLFVSLLSFPGAKYGLPSQYVIRTMVGDKGSMWVSSPVRTMTSLYWFSVQTIGGTLILQEMFRRALNIHIPFVILSMILALCMVYLAIVGFQAMKKITAVFTPFLLIAGGCMFYVFFTSNPEGSSFVQIISMNQDGWNGKTMFFYASLAFVQYVSGVSSSADLSRYSKTTTHAFWGIYLGNSIGFLCTALLGAYTAAAANHWNPFLITSQWTNSPILFMVIMIAAIFSMLTINMNNAYTGGYSLLNSLPRLGRIRSAVIFGLAGIGLSAYPGVVNEAEVFISLLGAFIIPLSAVIVADFSIIKKLMITRESLDLLATGGKRINHVAFITVLIGMVLYFALPTESSPGFIVFIISFILYLFVHQFVEKRKR